VRRGILGGTFDPPHIAHLIGGEAAYHELGLDVVTFIPAGAPWQKAGRNVSTADDRWQMVVLATGGTDYFEADNREVRRQGWTYTIDTLESFDADDEVTLILGADAALGLPTWERSEQVLRRASVAVIPRPGVDRDSLDGVLDSYQWLDVPELEISGTLLRDRVRSGRSIRFYVPDLVFDYVMHNGLYA
jgi:nicotinate-nucleotide adenylyltransferase